MSSLVGLERGTHWQQWPRPQDTKALSFEGAFWYNMLMDAKELAFQNLVDFKKILDTLGVPFFLEGGTLLGAYRDGDFCKDDEADIDLGTYSFYTPFIPLIIKKAEAQGFTLKNYWNGDARAPGKGQEIALVRGKEYIEGLRMKYDLKIDLLFYEDAGDTSWTLVYDRNRVGVARVVPTKNIKRRVPFTWKGVEFQIPNNVEDYLAYTYGDDWKTPKHRSEYSCYNPDDLKALKPEYKFWEK